MKKILSFCGMLICISAISLLCACNNEDDAEKGYGSGSPLAENVVQCKGYAYTYNSNGLVTDVYRVSESTDKDGNKTTQQELIAQVSYPKSDRAVMYCYENGKVIITYTFAFGENHFANRVIETDDDGETYLTKFGYNKEGYCTSVDKDDDGDHLKMEWTNGNLTKLQQNEYNARTELTYTDDTRFSFFGMSPFLLDVDLGPFMEDLKWWYDGGLEYALQIGFLGKPCRNLPATMTCYDNVNKEPTEWEFEYHYFDIAGYDPWGKWYLK